MKRLFMHERGISLMEVLATIVIASLIVTSIMSLLTFLKSENREQTAQIEQLTNVTIAFKSMTKHIRFVENVENIKAEGTYLHIPNPNGKSMEYKLQDDILYKNDTAYVHNIAAFSAEWIDNKVTLSIETKAGKTLHTEIAKREGDKL